VTRAAVPLLAYAGLVGVLAVVLWVWDSDPLPPALLGAAAVATAVTAGAWGVHGRRIARAGAADVRAVPDLSAATALLGFALPTMLVGLKLGLYLVYIGGGVTALCLGGLMREALAVRRARRRVHGG
jgi:hypothetical protein